GAQRRLDGRGALDARQHQARAGELDLLGRRPGDVVDVLAAVLVRRAPDRRPERRPHGVDADRAVDPQAEGGQREAGVEVEHPGAVGVAVPAGGLDAAVELERKVTEVLELQPAELAEVVARCAHAAYRASISAAYLAAIGRRLSFMVGVS